MTDPTHAATWAERYSRQILLKEIGGEGQRTLNDARVGILGSDGAARAALLYLAGAGVGEVRLADDLTEPREAMAHWARELNPTIAIRATPAPTTPEALAAWLDGLGLVIDCRQDWPGLNPLCHERVIPLLTNGFAADGRGWLAGSRAGSDPALPCLACQPLPAPAPTPDPLWFSLWQGLAGTMLATEATKALLRIGAPLLWSHTFTLDPATSDPHTVTRERNPACPVCAQAPRPILAATPALLPEPAATPVEATIDISRETCPMTFVRVKLKLATLAPGQRLRVRLSGGEPLHNVPLSLRDLGFQVSAPWQEGELYGLLVTKPDHFK
ncbi:MAG: sulfurtransferase TusA family protein [Magnetococcales bacterium]|nr:sulfurtransferase TusA family protein [Magnetococcales bacterium]